MPNSPVRQPCWRNVRTNVVAPHSSERSLKITPCALGIRPVMIVDRFGMHTGLATHALSNTTPRAATRSRCGVRTVSFPAKPAWSARC